MYLQQHFRSLFLLLATCSFALFTSCQSGPDSESVPEGQCTVTFTVNNYMQISFDDLSATRAVPSDHPSTLAHLLVAVYNAETGQQACTPIQHDHKDYEKNNAAYPKFSVSLPYGHYRVLVLGYNGSRECSIASLNHISWAENYVPNTFYYCEEFTLDAESSLDRQITLKHAVAAFCVMSEQETPAEVKKMRFVSTAGGTVLDATTGFTPQSTGRTSEIVIPSDHVGIKDTFTVYLFLPEEQISTNYTVQALGQNDALISQKQFRDVPLRINYLTEWQGRAFESSGEDVPDVQSGFSIKWDVQWADTLKLQP